MVAKGSTPVGLVAQVSIFSDLPDLLPDPHIIIPRFMRTAAASGSPFIRRVPDCGTASSIDHKRRCHPPADVVHLQQVDQRHTVQFLNASDAEASSDCQAIRGQGLADIGRLNERRA